jgi:isopentenyl diphosphate isomerase/L-lactate dehydrogenase-like FMN-dependent dehydrogenase
LLCRFAACKQARPPSGAQLTGGAPTRSRALAGGLISSPEQALDVFELEAVARQRVPPAHFGYLASGADDDKTVKANRDAFDKWYIRPRRMIDVTTVDTSVSLFGTHWPTPIVLAPIGSQRAFHPDGELASARAARTHNHLQILSSVTSTPVEEVAKARGAPLWFQLYPTTRWAIAQGLVRRADAAGTAAIVLTVDYPTAPNRETQFKAARLDPRDCKQCHTDPTRDLQRKPMYLGTGVTAEEFRASNLTWDAVARLRDLTSQRLLIKGILTAEDAQQCVRYGVDGIIVSNHGGRSMESGRATLDCLPEIVNVVARRIPVLVDSGFRRGTDLFKGLALGADAICVGRPCIWGLAAFGEAGIARALELLRTELESVMRLAGTTSLPAITRQAIGAA